MECSVEGCIVPIVVAIIAGLMALFVPYVTHFLERVPPAATPDDNVLQPNPPPPDEVVWREGNGNHVLYANGDVAKWGVRLPRAEADHFIAIHNLASFLH